MEKQKLFDSLCDGLNLTPTQGEMDDFFTALNKNGLNIIEIETDGKSLGMSEEFQKELTLEDWQEFVRL